MVGDCAPTRTVKLYDAPSAAESYDTSCPYARCVARRSPVCYPGGWAQSITVALDVTAADHERDRLCPRGTTQPRARALALDPERLNDYLHDVRSRTDRSYDETVREAVTLYRIATTVNLAPLKLVSEQLGVSVSTATRMMARAREAGLAVDLIARETYNRMRADEAAQTGPHVGPDSAAGPSIGR